MHESATPPAAIDMHPWNRAAPRLAKRMGRFVQRKPLGAVGGALVLLLLLTAVLAPVMAPSGYDDQDLRNRLASPSLDHPFGTDNLGRDVLSRIIYGSQVSVVVGFGAVSMSMVIATVIGVVSGFYGRWLDTLAQRVVDIWMAFPALVLLITIISIFSSTGRLQLVIALGIILAAGTSRIVRGATLALKANMYVEAARSIGASDLRVMVVHIIPNLVPIIIVLATVQIGAAILAEATISFLGYGIAPPFPTWGQMLSPSELALMRQHPHLSLFPGLTIAVTVYAFNVLGDALRDILDPRLRGT